MAVIDAPLPRWHVMIFACYSPGLEFRKLFGNIAVTGSMKTITPDPIFFVE